MKSLKEKWADGAGRRHLIQLSAITNLGLFAVVNVLLVAMIHLDTPHADTAATAMYTLKIFILANAVAALLSALIAPYAISTFERMQQRLTRQNNELRSLHAIDTAISAELNLDTILQVAVRHANQAVEGQFSALWLFSDSEGMATEAQAFHHVAPALQPLVCDVMASGPEESFRRLDQALRKTGIQEYWSGNATLAALNLRTTINVPIKHQERTVGVLMVANRRETLGQRQEGFTIEDEELLTAIATTVGVAVQNAWLYEETERRGAMLRSLVARIGDAIAASSDASLLMQVLADEAKRILGCARVAVYDFDDSMEQFLPLAAADDEAGPRSTVDLFYRQPLDMDIVLPPEADNPDSSHYYDNVRQALGLGTTVPPTGDRQPASTVGLFLNHPGFLFVLRSREKNCIGLLCMLDSTERNHSKEARAFAHALASQAAVALENARLAARTHALLAQAHALQDATNKIAAELDIDRVLAGVMDSARGVLAADGYTIWDFEAEGAGWQRRAGDGLAITDQGTISPAPSGTGALTQFEGGQPREVEALNKVLREQAPLVIGNTAHTPVAQSLSLGPADKPTTTPRGRETAATRLAAARGSVRAMLALPLVYGGKTTGVMALYYKNPRTFIPAEVSLAQSFAHQVANALENARIFAELSAMYRREKRIAGELQVSLLPPIPPEVGRFHVSYRYQAGLNEAAVGGDFLDLFFLGPQTMGLVIADVSGKGLPAAVQTAMIKYTLRAFADEIPKNPAEVLERVNNVLCSRNTGIQGFVTLFFGVLDGQTGVLTYANAGHELPLLCDGETGWVCGLPMADGIALGCMPNMDFQNRTAILDPGNTLLLYTDGLTEARNVDTGFLGLDGLRKFVACCKGSDVETAIQSIYDQVQDYAGDTLRDDVAMLLVQRQPAN